MIPLVCLCLKRNRDESVCQCCSRTNRRRNENIEGNRFQHIRFSFTQFRIIYFKNRAENISRIFAFTKLRICFIHIYVYSKYLSVLAALSFYFWLVSGRIVTTCTTWRNVKVSEYLYQYYALAAYLHYALVKPYVFDIFINSIFLSFRFLILLSHEDPPRLHAVI